MTQDPNATRISGFDEDPGQGSNIPEQKNNRNLIIAIVAAVIVLCCCCPAIVYGLNLAWNNF